MHCNTAYAWRFCELQYRQIKSTPYLGYKHGHSAMPGFFNFHTVLKTFSESVMQLAFNTVTKLCTLG